MRILLAPLLILSLLAGACAQPGLPGRLEHDPRAAALFTAGTILPGHRYYAFGPEAEPDAVVAIDDSLDWSSGYWYPIEATPAYFSAWLRRIDTSPQRERVPLYGATIFDPDGKAVGLWFGWPEFVVIRFPAEGQLQIFPPAATQLQRLRLGGPEDGHGNSP